MCDYYEFSNSLCHFLYGFNTQRLKALYNIEVHRTNIVIVNIIVTDENMFEYYRNKIVDNESELRRILKKQITIFNDAEIIYNHVSNIPKFEKEHDRNIEIDFIVKYYM